MMHLRGNPQITRQYIAEKLYEQAKKTVFLVEKPEIWNITSSDVQENSNLNGQRNLLTYDIK